MDNQAGFALELEHAIGFLGISDALFWHPDGQNIVYPAGGTVVICDLNDPHKQHMLHGHGGNITCMALSPSGRLIASGQRGENADAIVWEYGTRRLLYRLAEHDVGVQAVSFSDDESMLCTVGALEDHKILVWDMSNGHIVTIVQHSPAPTTAVCWGGMVRDVKRRDTADYQLATAGNKQVMLWALNPYTGEMHGERVRFEGRGSMVRDYTKLAFSKDKETLYCATSSGDFTTASVKSKFLGPATPACHLGAHALCPRLGGSLLVGGGDGSVVSFDPQGRDCARTRLQGAVTSLSCSPDSQEVIVGTDLGFMYRVQLSNFAAHLVSQAHHAPVTCVSYAPGHSDRFATAACDGTLRVWDACDYTVVATALVKDGGAPLCLEMSQDMLVSGWSGGRIRTHDVDTGKELWVIDNAHQGGVTALVLAHNQRYVMTGGQEGEVRIWEMRSRELVSHLKQHGQRVPALALYGDDVHALSVSRDRSLICWDLRSEKQVSHHSQRMGGINSVALSRDQATVLTVGQEKRVTYWDLREHTPARSKDLSKDMDDEGLALAVSHCGRLFATGGTGRLVKIWHYESATLVAVGRGHSGDVTGLQFSPDDKQLVSVGADGNVLVWNVYM